MGSNFNSVDNMIGESYRNGIYSQLLFLNTPGVTTNANTTSGYETIQRHPITFAVPSVGGANLTMRFPNVKLCGASANSTLFCGIEYELGSLAVSGNAYTDGVAMPSKTLYTTSEQTAAALILLVSTVTLTATTPVVTINYTNQDGTTGRSCTLTLPSSVAANSAFLVTPHLQSGDTGIRDLSASGPNGLSISTGSAGTLKLYGILPLAYGAGNNAGTISCPSPMAFPANMWPCLSGEKIGFYRLGSNQAVFSIAHLVGIGDN
jgi:hypothetical protein